jgi:glycosyltransferase involved in cell wall biosynthesis
MRILLLQDQLYLPSFGGGNKATRLLLEGLVRRGHDCAVVSPGLTGHEGPKTEPEFHAAMAERGIAVTVPGPGRHRYRFEGVEVDTLCSKNVTGSRPIVLERIEAFRPDWVIVSDDRQKVLLESALHGAPECVAYLVQTIIHVPFGPLAAETCADQARRVARARARFVISEFLGEYMREHAQLDSHTVRLPVYGEGPFPVLGDHGRGSVTMVNPCVAKGLDVFLDLARHFPAVDFAAVPTWGADEGVFRALDEQPNVRLLQPADDIEEILAQTRVLVAPSLWPETLGYVVIEAMLRGIPVLASDMGGLREAKLGVDYLLPVRPAERRATGYVSPPQDTAPWRDALAELLDSEERYARCSRDSRAAALAFIAPNKVEAFEGLLAELGAG